MSYLSTRPLTAQLIVQDEQLEALVDSCDPTAFNRPRYNGYPTGQINVKIFPQVTILGFVKFNIGSRVVSISCPDEIRGLFDLLKTGP